MQCRDCNADNSTQAKFCIECGAPFQRSCPSCGAENVARAKFCEACGSSMTGAQPSDAPLPAGQPAARVDGQSSGDGRRAQEAERRQLTVMFCDLVESTALASQLDPEDFRDFVRAYQESCAAVIERFSGHIAQYLGDGLLVYFGYPQAHEDDAQRAVRAALGILDAITTLHTRLDLPRDIRLSVRLGIHTGLVVVGEVGGGSRHERLALGETPNIAARLEALAEPDTAVLSAATQRLIDGYFTVEDLGPHSLKGVPARIRAYRVLEERGAESRFDVAVSSGLTPLIGREAEAAMLYERWNLAISGMGQVVLLSGEAGIGKSRLVQALRDHVADVPHHRLEYRCSTYYQNTTLYPLVENMRYALQLTREDSPADKLKKLERHLGRYRLPLEVSVPLFGPLLSLPLPPERYAPLTMTPERQKQKTLETFLAITLELAEQRPVLFVMEDLHWVDPSTLEFLKLLVDQAPTAPLCVLFSCRPEFRQPWGARAHIAQLAINRLQRTQVEHMVEQLAGDRQLPAEMLKQVVAKTDGVPLFVEELTKMVLESGLLKEANGHYEMTGPLPPLAIPTTVQDSLMARLDRLAAVKAVAQLGAVLGREFSYELLQAVSSSGEATLRQELGKLVEAELLYQRGMPPQATYTFKHALVQDAAYQSLLKSSRQQYHQRVARTLEERFPETAETQPELVAHHYTEADLREQAMDYWRQAAKLAQQRSAYLEAIAFFTRALEVNDHIASSGTEEKLIPLYEGRGGVWLLLTKYDDAINDFRTMLDLARSSGDRLQEGESLCHLAFAHWSKFSEDEMPFVERYSNEAMQIFEQTGDQRILAKSLTSLAQVHQVRGDLKEADKKLEESLKISRREGYTSVVGQNLLWLGAQAYWQGNFASAIQVSKEGIDVAHEIHDGLSELFGLAFLCNEHWSIGDCGQAFTVLRDAMAKAKDWDNKLIPSRLTNTLGWFHNEFGDYSRAAEYDQQSVEMGREFSIPNVEISALINLGFDHFKLGDHERALSIFEPTLERVDRDAFGAHRWRWKVRLFIGLGEAHYAAGAYSQALRSVEDGLKEAQATSSRKYVAHGWALRGKIIAAQGNREIAGGELQRAFHLAEKLRCPSILYPLAFDLGQWREQEGNEQQAARLYQTAKNAIDAMAASVDDQALRGAFLQTPLVQSVSDSAARIG